MTDGQMILLADVILVLHFCIAIFLTYGLPVIWLGAWRGWKFVRAPWFRYTHAGLMGFVVLEALAGKLCPLTIWEATLRRAVGQDGPGDGQGFIAHWVGRLLFHDFEPWVFTVAYVVFFLAVLGTFFFVPVRKKLNKRENAS
ncbi:DUF2784 domain-containing protein [Pseudodesulfovibrio sp. zrk46]|uniref:DUF2784 domain-containing protein n=1 Tax=Pseudodesulfovibrio sp. zrk46 TaxID=2725288 RepID=UPI00144A0B26|nr:DUF2784 domain-containing protein [Pseudodesulfovibrio sp. zrk46]QJB55707.1 DUF2784 domain-containing protein [Pseudodesulfovibrio sp. zrk46]